MSKETDLAWLAGFFDGEGSITISCSRSQGVRTVRRSYQGHVNVSNSRRELIQHCIAITKAFDVPPTNVSVPNGTYNLTWCSIRGAEFLLKLSPLLRHPKQQRRATLYCEFYDPRKRGIHRPREKDKLFEKWQALKKIEKQKRNSVQPGAVATEDNKVQNGDKDHE